MNAARFRSFAGFLLVLLILISSGDCRPAAAQTRRSFRISTLNIPDPQIFHAINNCGVAANSLINLLINTQYLNVCEPVTEGVPDPCTFGLNLVAVFDPLVQTAGPTTDLVQCMSGGQPCELDFSAISECTRTGGTGGTIACNGEPSFVFPTTYSNGGFVDGLGATCLTGLAGTFGANNSGLPPIAPVMATATGNCGVTGLIELNIEVGDGLLTIPLKSAQLAARYVGNPATALTSGLARGFLSEAAADAIMIDIDITSPVVVSIHGPLSSLLAGGTGNCKTTNDDRDYNPPGDTVNGERGWWFYLTFSGTLVTVPEFPTPTATFTMVQATATPPPPTDTPVPTDTPINTPTHTSAPTNTPLPTNTPMPTSTPTNSPVGVSCAGDCDGNGMVPINEVQKVANIYLGSQELSGCTSADRDGDLEVAINEVVLASRSYQFDCPVP